MGVGGINAKEETKEDLLEKHRYFYYHFLAEEWKFVVLLAGQR